MLKMKVESKRREERREKKKKKKQKKKKKHSSSSSSDSSKEKVEWVEKETPTALRTAPAHRDEWMMAPGLLEGIVNQERRKAKKESTEETNVRLLDVMGQSDRELNPYWKDGGNGLPRAGTSRPSISMPRTVGDSGAGWLRRALERAKQQAEEEGRSLEEVASERWGSLCKLQAMVEEAEGTAGNRTYRDRREGQRLAFHKPRDDDGTASSRGERAPRNVGSKRWKKRDDVTEADGSAKGKPQEGHAPELPATNVDSGVLTEQQMNELAAKLVKAEIMGNDSLATELRTKLETARQARKKKSEGSSQAAMQETVVLLSTNTKGFTCPMPDSQLPPEAGGRRRKHSVESRKDGKKVRHFLDDDKYSLHELFQQEKSTTSQQANEMFNKMAVKSFTTAESEYNADHVFDVQNRQSQREFQRATEQHKRENSCRLCLDSKHMLRHLVVAIGNKAYLSLPSYRSLTDGHCLIIPAVHVPCATQLDEDVWLEMQSFRAALTAMFLEMDKDAIFFETAMNLRSFPHMALHCVPVPREEGDTAPVYFKKAILECETEWALNKKLVDLRDRDIRRAVPKGLPYFAVGFGTTEGFAHVIEDENLFPHNFAQEVIGGMLDLEHNLWRKRLPEPVDVQCKKVTRFAGWWKPHDITTKLLVPAS